MQGMEQLITDLTQSNSSSDLHSDSNYSDDSKCWKHEDLSDTEMTNNKTVTTPLKWETQQVKHKPLS
jgi:hypothetical protein